MRQRNYLLCPLLMNMLKSEQAILPVARILKGTSFVFLYRCSHLHVHEKNMNIFNACIHVCVDSLLYLYS